MASFLKPFSWPIRRLFDPRFGGLAQQADSQHQDLAQRLEVLQNHVADRPTLEHELERMRDTLTAIARADLEATREANELFGRSLGDLLAEASTATALLTSLRLRDLEEGSVEDLDAPTADFLNYASSHRGFAAQRGVWFNPPISLQYGDAEVVPADTNERIVELPYAFRALARLESGSTVLDVGAAESTVAFSLASLGYEVTALDLHPYPLSHPQLESVEGDILEWEPGKTFDAVLCISTLEHLGLGAYGDEPVSGADGRALDRIRALTKAGGILILTTPFGAASGDRTQRGYERTELERLLDDWTIEDFTVVRRQDDLTWALDDGSVTDETRRVALVTAVRPPD